MASRFFGDLGRADVVAFAVSGQAIALRPGDCSRVVAPLQHFTAHLICEAMKHEICFRAKRNEPV